LFYTGNKRRYYRAERNRKSISKVIVEERMNGVVQIHIYRLSCRILVGESPLTFE